MTESSSGPRIKIHWSLEARSDLRAIDRETALQILNCLGRYTKTGSGDIKQLKPPFAGFRLRCGDYRVFFHRGDEKSIEIESVRHRSEAYR